MDQDSELGLFYSEVWFQNCSLSQWILAWFCKRGNLEIKMALFMCFSTNISPWLVRFLRYIHNSMVPFRTNIYTWNIRTYLMETKDDDRSKNPDPHWVSVAFLQAHIPSQKRIQLWFLKALSNMGSSPV